MKAVFKVSESDSTSKLPFRFSKWSVVISDTKSSLSDPTIFDEIDNSNELEYSK